MATPEETATVETTEDEQTAPPADETTAETAPPEADAPEGEDEGSEDESEDAGSKLTLEEAIKELGRVRAEAASRRTENRELKDALAKAKSPEDYEAAVNDYIAKLEAAERAITVRDVADEFGIPKELRDFLTGKTEEELKAQAKVLQGHTTATPPSDLRGGVEPDDDDDGEYDPGKLAKKYGRTW